MLRRILIPSWSFFENTGATPDLYYRFYKNESELIDNKKNEWSKHDLKTDFSFLNLVFNYSINKSHFINSSLHRVLVASNHANFPNNCIDFQFIQNLIKNKLPAGHQNYQFKIVCDNEDIIISEVFEA